MRCTGGPYKRRHAAGRQVVLEAQVTLSDRQVIGLAVAVDGYQHHRTIARVLERHFVDPRVGVARLHPRGARHDEPAEMGKRVVLVIATDRAGGGVDGDYAFALIAAAGVRAMVFVQRNVPVHNAARPVGDTGHHDIAREQQQLTLLGGRPVTAGTFGEVHVLLRERTMHRGLRGRVTAIAMPGDAGEIASRIRISQHAQGFVRQIPIVVPTQDRRRRLASGQRRTQILADDAGTCVSGHGHAGVGQWLEGRFVLHGQCKDRNAVAAVRIDKAHQIVRISGFPGFKQTSADHVGTGFHPCWRAPRRGNDQQIRLNGQDVTQHRYDIALVHDDIEVLQARIGLAGRHVIQGVVLQREIRGADGDAQHVEVEPGRRTEQFLQQRAPLRRVQLVLDQPCRRISECRAKPGHGLVLPTEVNDHIGIARDGVVPVGENVGLLCEAQAAVRRAQPHTDRNSGGRKHPGNCALERSGARPVQRRERDQRQQRHQQDRRPATSPLTFIHGRPACQGTPRPPANVCPRSSSHRIGAGRPRAACRSCGDPDIRKGR